MKTLKQVLQVNELYKPKSPDEDKFVKKHVAVKHKDANGNDDAVFNGSNVKPVDRKAERHGYSAGEDEEMYESVEQPTLEEASMKDHAEFIVRQANKRAEVKPSAEHMQSSVNAVHKVLANHEDLRNQYHANPRNVQVHQKILNKAGDYLQESAKVVSIKPLDKPSKFLRALSGNHDDEVDQSKLSPEGNERRKRMAAKQKPADVIKIGEQADSDQVLIEKAPPGMEDWVKRHKKDFKDTSVLYATAWKMYNKKKNK